MPELAGSVADAFATRTRELEERAFAPGAVRSFETLGRERPEQECGVRTPFQRDRDRILHSKPFRRLKGKIVRIVDRVAYINHDIDDAIRYGILEEGDLPRDEIEVLGPTGAKRIDRLVHDLVESSDAVGDVVQGPEVGAAMLSLRTFM